MARRGSRAGRLTERGYSGDNRNMQATGRISRSSPTLYAGVFGREEPVYCTLTQLDYLAPFASGRALPDLPQGWRAPDVSELRAAYAAAVPA